MSTHRTRPRAQLRARHAAARAPSEGPAALRVLLDVRPASTPTGIGRYAATLGELVGQVAGIRAFRLGGPRPDIELGAKSALDEAFELPALLERERIDVLHSAMLRLPPVVPRGVRTVVTLHDAIPVVRPDLCSVHFAAEFVATREALDRADAIVCPSEHARGDAIRALGVDPARVHVVGEAPAALFGKEVDAEAQAAVRARCRLSPDPFVLVVGALDRRKNPILMLEALRRLRITRVDAAFAGPRCDVDVAAEAIGRGVEDRVRVLGYVPDADLAALYHEAAALVFPSRYEGFGLPIVEAFASGTPVIASNAAALPEVAGDGALLVGPDDADGLARAIRSILGDRSLRDRLRARGRERLARFSREAIACRLAEVYRAAVESSGVL